MEWRAAHRPQAGVGTIRSVTARPVRRTRATPEVIVHPTAGELVESVGGRLQSSCVHLDLPGQLGQRTRADDQARLLGTARNPTGRQATEPVTTPVLGVDDQPGNRLRPEFSNPAIQCPAEVVARASLVGETMAARVNDKTVRRRQLLLGVPNRASGVPDTGTPPSVAHARQFQPQFGSPLELPDTFAARLAQRPGRAGRRRQELPTRGGVPLEAALSDDDASSCQHPNRTSGPADLDADHSTGRRVFSPLGQQPKRRRVPPDVHLQTLTRCQ